MTIFELLRGQDSPGVWGKLYVDEKDAREVMEKHPEFNIIKMKTWVTRTGVYRTRLDDSLYYRGEWITGEEGIRLGLSDNDITKSRSKPKLVHFREPIPGYKVHREFSFWVIDSSRGNTWMNVVIWYQKK